MKLPLMILLINVAVAVVFSLILAGINATFISTFGVVSLLGGVVDIIVGLFLLFMKDKRYAQGFLMSAGVLMLVGLVTCGGSSSRMNF